MGTMAKVVFYKKENDKFKIMRSFVTLYDGSYSVCKKLCRLMEGIENSKDLNISAKNIISSYADYAEYDNRLVGNVSEKTVDLCYKIYFDEKGCMFSISTGGKPICTKVNFDEFEKQIMKIIPPNTCLYEL